MSAFLHCDTLSLPCEVLSISRFKAESSIKRNGNNIFSECKWITICNHVCMKNGNIQKWPPSPPHKMTQILKERSPYCDKKLKKGSRKVFMVVISHFHFYNLFVLWKGYWSRESGWSMHPNALLHSMNNFSL